MSRPLALALSFAAIVVALPAGAQAAKPVIINDQMTDVINDQMTDVAPAGEIAADETAQFSDCGGGCAFIGRGQSGDHVTAVQQCLRARGFTPVKADGHFGPTTEAAVRNYQTAAGIGSDGVVGSETFHSLGLHEGSPANCGG